MDQNYSCTKNIQRISLLKSFYWPNKTDDAIVPIDHFLE